jgi:hypothetical protein
MNIDSDTAKRIQTLERTVDILSRHLLSNCRTLEAIVDVLPHSEYSYTIRSQITNDIELLQQLKKLSKQ